MLTPITHTLCQALVTRIVPRINRDLGSAPTSSLLFDRRQSYALEEEILEKHENSRYALAVQQ